MSLINLSPNKKKRFNISLNPEIFEKAEKHGYTNSVFDGEEIKGNIELTLTKPEMIKCVRLQLIGYIAKGSKLTTSEILKFINDPQYENEIQAITAKLKKLNNDIPSKNQVNPHLNTSSTGNTNSSSKFEKLTVLVDYDVVLWGKYSNKKKKNQDSPENNTNNRLEQINQDFTSTRMNCEPMEFPFTFKLFNKNKIDPLPSSYKDGKCTVVYFLFATINRPWPRKNSTRIMYIRVLQKIKVDIPKYLGPLEVTKQKELKIMKYIKNGVVEMIVKLPRMAFCHRENIPIEVKINHMGMNKTIFGFGVGLYEKCYYKDKIKELSVKLILERFYKFNVKPGETDKCVTLNFQLVDGNCYIEKSLPQFVLQITKSKSGSSNVHICNISCASDGGEGNNSDTGNDVDGDNNNSNSNDNCSSNCNGSCSSCNKTGIKELHSEKSFNGNEEAIVINDNNPEGDINDERLGLTLCEAKVGCVSVDIKHDNWPLKVEHVLKVVAITNENVAGAVKKLQAQQEKEEKEVTSVKNNEMDMNSSMLEENSKYGIITGNLFNCPSLQKMKKILECELNVVIGSLTNSKREFGTEKKISSEIEDQYFKSSNVIKKLKWLDNKKDDNQNGKLKERARAFSYDESYLSKLSASLNKTSETKLHTKYRSVTSGNLNKAINDDNTPINKELPKLPPRPKIHNIQNLTSFSQPKGIANGIERPMSMYPNIENSYYQNTQYLNPSAPSIDDVKSFDCKYTPPPSAPCIDDVDGLTYHDSPPPSYDDISQQYSYINDITLNSNSTISNTSINANTNANTNTNATSTSKTTEMEKKYL